MNKVIGCLMLVLGAFLCKSSYAQVMAQKPQWVTIKSANLRCWECKNKLEKYLISENESTMQSGMLQRKYNLLNGEISIFYLPDRVDVETIKITIANAGFDADDEKAEEKMYKKLPPQCKRAEDGGGPQKGKPCHIQPN